MRLAVALVVLASVVCAPGARGQRADQGAPTIANGSRVRLTLSREEARISGRETVAGTLLGTDGQRAVVARPGVANPDTVATFTIDEFEVYDGQRSRPRMILAGAAAGAGASLIVYAVDQSSQAKRCKRNPDPGCKRFITPGAYAAPIVVGALFGSTFSSARWRSVPRDIVSVAAGIDRGVSIASTVHFR